MRAVTADGGHRPVSGHTFGLIRHVALGAGLALLLGAVTGTGRAQPDGKAGSAKAALLQRRSCQTLNELA